MIDYGKCTWLHGHPLRAATEIATCTHRHTLVMTAGGFSVSPSPLGVGNGWTVLARNASSLSLARRELPPARGSCLQLLNRLTFTFPIVLSPALKRSLNKMFLLEPQICAGTKAA